MRALAMTLAVHADDAHQLDPASSVPRSERAKCRLIGSASAQHFEVDGEATSSFGPAVNESGS